MAKTTTDIFGGKLNSSNFNAENYIRELCVSAQGAPDLAAKRQKILAASEEVNGLLKKNVYKNYTQFIETAREISYLETEMYQLSHMLSEQKSLMNSLLEISLTGDKVITSKEKGDELQEEETKKNLTSLLEKVEGCANIMDVPGRYIVYSSDLTELDAVNFTKLRRMHIFLLNDSVMLASWIPHKRGPVRYKFQILYELESLAVVNVRDIGQLTNAFKLLMFPDTRHFCCETLKAKKELLEYLECTKKSKTNFDQRRDSASDRTWKQMDAACGDDYELPDWLIELPEDLDVLIAERNFEAAVQLIEKCNQYCADQLNANAIKELKVRVDQRLTNLTGVLTNELKITPDKSLQGGPRAARRAVQLLIRLGKSGQASNLYLLYRSAHLKHVTKQLKTEGVTSLYIERLCATFFSHLRETCDEFVRAFTDFPDCFSAFVLWATSEINNFAINFSRQVLSPQASFSTTAASVELARSHCQAMTNSGLDFVFHLDCQLQPQVEKIILDAKDKLLEAVKLRAQEDKWRPMNLQNKQGLEKFLDDTAELGLSIITKYVYDECWICLTNNTINFTKACIIFLDDVLKFFSPHTRNLISDALVELFRAQLNHVSSSYSNENFKSSITFIQKNAAFLLEVLLTNIEKRFEEKTTEKCFALSRLHFEFKYLASDRIIGEYL
uniref:Exocyst component Exo84 C-terminal domain-containing protein n=1 Tax=Strigamia maritima TaxID=126957 RepID=T1J4C7_STRMM